MSTANEWDVELNTRREISYLQASMYYFVYHINKIALYWQEKSTFIMNESKSIDNPRIKIVKSVGAKAQDVKMRWIITKTTMGVVFSSPTKEIGTWQIFQWSIFALSCVKCHYQSHWIHNLNVTICKLYGFFRVLATIIRENSGRRPWNENGEGFAVHSSTWPSGVKASDVSAADWRY